jgi:hypothetical protein
MPLEQVRLKVRVAVCGRVQQQLPLFAGALLAEVPEHRGNRTDDLRVPG